MYIYYKQITDSEHYLSQTEIAAASGFKSTNHNPHVQLIGAAFKEYMGIHKIEPVFYYSETHHKMLKVFPKSIYLPALENLYLKIGENQKGTIEIGGIKYSYILTHKAVFGGVA